MDKRWCLASIPAAAALVSACTPAAVFTSARPLARGQVNGYAFVDITGAALGESRSDPRETPANGDRKGVVPGGGLRVGVAKRLELGARVGPSLGELSALVNLIDQPVWALGIAPRIQTGWGAPALGRLPLLLSYDIAPSLTLTPRFGVGYGVGGFRESKIGFSYDDQGSNRERFAFSSGFLEGGLGMQFRLGRYVGLALDVYYLRSVGSQEVVVPGGGLALMFGRQPEPRAAAANNGQ